MEIKRRVSLCPECTACPEVQVLHDESGPVAVWIGEINEGVVLPRAAWNVLVQHVKDGNLDRL